MTQENVSPKVALITGGARGIGAATAEVLAARGMRVVIGDVRADEGRETAQRIGEAASFVDLDVTSEDSWQDAMGVVETEAGRLDVLVNNAGNADGRPLVMFDLEHYRSVIDVHQIGVALGIASAIPMMRQAGGGSIVNVSSAAGLVGVLGASAYVSSKFATRGMTKAAALELGALGIRVNSVHPGFIMTPLVAELFTDEVKEAMAPSVPLRRIGNADEVAKLIAFLASDDASYCTGGEYTVDGGYTCGRATEPERAFFEQVYAQLPGA